MLRALVVLMLLANLVFFGWARGWLAPAWPAPHHGEREPERLAAQLHPQAVTVLGPQAASAAVAAARAAAAVCLQAGPWADAELAAAEAALAPAQLPEGSWSREPVPPPPPWVVFVGRPADPAALRQREEELRRLEIAYEPVPARAEQPAGFVLSRHATQAEAATALAGLVAPAASQPLRGVRVLALAPPPAQHWLRVARADADMQTRLQSLPPAALGGGFKPCVTPP
jgi:hypothetical protein